MVLVDGKKIAGGIAEHIKARVAGLSKPPRLTVLACNPNFETQKYLALKKAKAEALGIMLTVNILEDSVDTEAFCDAVLEAAATSEGIVVQLPLPAHIDTPEVLRSVPITHDVDAFSYEEGTALVLPPVVGAIDEISNVHHVSWQDKRVVIFGSGRLVGAPARAYALKRGAQVTTVTEHTSGVEALAGSADIIILGVGKPNLLTPSMVREGVVVFDAGASEDGGLLVGDAALEVSTKAQLLTPVPGGIGPITVVLLFRNLLDLENRQ